jgi:ribosomal-protein-alanine acetyltransferase
MIEVRPGTPPDLPAIGTIQAGSREASHWMPGEYLSYSILVAVEDGAVVGFVVTRLVAAGEFEVLNLAVGREYRRRGVGRLLVKAATAGSPGEYYLEVRESNRVARSFYRGIGFEEVGIRRKYYTDPDEPAIVMRIRS